MQKHRKLIAIMLTLGLVMGLVTGIRAGGAKAATAENTVKASKALTEEEELLKAEYPSFADLADEGMVGAKVEYRDIIKLGKWELPVHFYGSGEKQDIEWEVLKYSADKKSALVISRYIVGHRAYEDNSKEATWESCSLRKWLNETFFKKAFTKAERALIKTTAVADPANTRYKTKGGNKTKDKLFIMSEKEYKKYYGQTGKNDSSYDALGFYTTSGKTDDLWLRTPGENRGKAVTHDSAGVYRDGDAIYMSRSVRPMFWIKLTDNIISKNNLSIGGKSKGSEATVYVTLGTYDAQDEEGKKGGAAPIEWQIIGTDENKGTALLASRYILSKSKFNKGKGATNWKNSSIRKWLNGTFFNNSFSSKEKALIKQVVVKNAKADTRDSVYLLSKDETEEFLKTDQERIGAYRDGECGEYWLRDNEYDESLKVVCADGYVYRREANKKNGVRPVITIYTDLAKAKLTEPAVPKASVKVTKDRTGVEIAVEKTEDADGYYIYFKSATDSEPVLAGQIDEDGTMERCCTLRNIAPGKYSVSLRAFRKTGETQLTSGYSKATEINVSGFDEADYVAKNYPELKALADEGILGFNAVHARSTVKFGSWNMAVASGENKEGDTIYTASKDKKEIEWEVLEYSRDRKSALLVSKYLIDCRQFNGKDTTVTWSDSDIRKWLNDEFLNGAFNTRERDLIQTTKVQTRDSKDGVKGGPDTEDKVFLLSAEEADRFYPANMSGKRPEILASFTDGSVEGWWLRSPGRAPTDFSDYDEEDYEDLEDEDYGKCFAACADTYCNLETDGLPVNYARGIRPAIRIDLTSELIEANDLSTDDPRKDVGELYVTMGMYGGSGIEWKILDYDRRSGEALLVSRYLVDKYEYNKDGSAVTWEDCGLREWLNGEFLNAAFADAEQAKLLTSAVSLDQKGTKETKDKLYILSAEEMKTFFPARSKREIGRICTDEDGDISEWWLRTLGPATAYGSCINYEGSIWSNNGNGFRYGVRPVFRLDISGK